MKKILSVFFTIGLLFSLVGCITEEDTNFTPKNKAQEIVYNMQFGWNLGNTLDATPWNDDQNRTEINTL